jgi:hypothetical protein
VEKLLLADKVADLVLVPAVEEEAGDEEDVVILQFLKRTKNKRRFDVRLLVRQGVGRPSFIKVF